MFGESDVRGERFHESENLSSMPSSSTTERQNASVSQTVSNGETPLGWNTGQEFGTLFDFSRNSFGFSDDPRLESSTQVAEEYFANPTNGLVWPEHNNDQSAGTAEERIGSSLGQFDIASLNPSTHDFENSATLIDSHTASWLSPDPSSFFNMNIGPVDNNLNYSPYALGSSNLGLETSATITGNSYTANAATGASATISFNPIEEWWPNNDLQESFDTYEQPGEINFESGLLDTATPNPVVVGSEGSDNYGEGDSVSSDESSGNEGFGTVHTVVEHPLNLLGRSWDPPAENADTDRGLDGGGKN
jgi:hypothetical protein